MTELLAVLTSIYVLYVLYEIFQTVSQSDLAAAGSVTEAPKAESATPLAPAQPSAVEPPPPKPASATVAAAPAPVRAEPAKLVNLRNPVTGEVSPVPGNYRFAKKWIKEAIVTEGLLNKVYKNSELTEAVNPKVRAAIEEFKKLEKYHV